MRMVTLLIVSLTLANSLSAQVKYMVKAGASWTTASLNKDINDQLAGTLDYGWKTGFIMGLAVAIPLGGDRFTLQPELLFHQKGYTSKYSDTDESADYTTTLNYFELPVLARLNFGKFYVGAGTYFALGVGGKYKGSNTWMGRTAHHEGKVKFGEAPENYNGSHEYYNAVDLGLQLATGVKFGVAVFDLRFGLGLIDLIDRNDASTTTLNQSLQLTVGFPLIRKKKY